MVLGLNNIDNTDGSTIDMTFLSLPMRTKSKNFAVFHKINTYLRLFIN